MTKDNTKTHNKEEVKKKKEPVKQVKTGEKNRGKDGKFKPGKSGNPNGRPKELSITELIRKALEKIPNKKKNKTKAILLVEKILDKAIKDGDSKMIEKIWAYIDGMPKQAIELGGSEKHPITILLERIYDKKQPFVKKSSGTFSDVDGEGVGEEDRGQKVETEQSVLH